MYFLVLVPECWKRWDSIHTFSVSLQVHMPNIFSQRHLCSPGWPQTWDSHTSVSQGLGSQIRSTQLGSGSPFVKHEFEHWMLSPFSPGCLQYKSHFLVKYIELSSNVSILPHIWSPKYMQCRSQAVSLECVHWYYVKGFSGITDTINLEASRSKLSSWMCITSRHNIRTTRKTSTQQQKHQAGAGNRKATKYGSNTLMPKAGYPPRYQREGMAFFLKSVGKNLF